MITGDSTKQKAAPEHMQWIPAGSFLMGSDRFYPEEAPVREVSVNGFWIDIYAVTNRDYTKFVDDTGYVTVAERPLNPADYPGALPGMLVPGALVFKPTSGPVDLRDWSQWWEYVPGASWKHPDGPGSSVRSRGDYPVVHIAFEDAETYARWAGKRLPTEAEWEYAARGGLVGASYCWGEEMEPAGRPAANTWQGEFPWHNLGTDGYERTAPVGTFPANGYGLFDMAGNVWEWTTDWFVARRDSVQAPCCSGSKGPDAERSYDPNFQGIRIPRKVVKGGSHLCAPNYCLRFRPAARSPQMVDTGMSHLGFRCVKDE